VPSQDGSEELVLSRVGRGGRISGILVEIHDIRPHVRLDQLKSTVVVASGVRLRNALTSVAGYAEMARDADPDQREVLLERVRTRIADAVSELDRAEQLAGTRIGENPIQPVFLPDAVREAATGLDLGRRSRIDLSLPEISTPVAARSGPLVRALGGLFGVLAGQGGRVKIEVWPAEDGMRLSLLDDSGGLPAGMLERMVDPDSPSLAGGAVAEIRDMGASLFQETAAGAGTRLVLAFPYYA
jgi:signal transduction histidine kinase